MAARYSVNWILQYIRRKRLIAIGHIIWFDANYSCSRVISAPRFNWTAFKTFVFEMETIRSRDSTKKKTQ